MKNLIIRALTGAAFVAVIIAGICVHPYLFLLVFGLVTALSLWEFYGLMNAFRNKILKRFISSLGGVYLFFSSFVYAYGLIDGKIFIPYLVFLMYTFISELYNKKSDPIHNWAFTLLAQVYCAGSFSLLNFIYFSADTLVNGIAFPLFVLALFVFIWLNDTGAFLVGSTIGKHRLFERVSPKKSWEGFCGGLIVALAASQIFAYYEPEVSRWVWLGFSAVVVVFGTWGDLTESLMKRTLGVKDSGSILPGHGGMLDRFDSVIMAIPAVYIYIELFIRN